MLTKQRIQMLRKAAELQIEGLDKLAEASELQDQATSAAMLGTGDPAPATVEPSKEEIEVLSLPEEVKTASILALSKVAKELSNSNDEASLKLALEIDSIAGEINKNAFEIHVEKTAAIIQKDTANPTKSIDDITSKGIAVVEGKVSEGFHTDTTTQVSDAINGKIPYQKL